MITKQAFVYHSLPPLGGRKTNHKKQQQPQQNRNKQWILPNLSLWTLRFDSGILEVMVAPLIYVENLMRGNNLE
jgi:hypothetical protein